jgi:hypothetical protein
MILNFARFDLTYKGQAYRVDFHVYPARYQDGSQKINGYTYSIFTGTHLNACVFSGSGSGRQAVSPWNAGQLVKRYLQEKAASLENI